MAEDNVVRIVVKDKDDTSFAKYQAKAETAGAQSGKGFMSRFASFVTPSKFQFIASGIASAMAVLPALGAIGGVALVAGLGVAIASHIKGVQNEFKDFGKQAMATLQQAVRPLLPVITSVLKQVSGFLKQIAPQLAGLFRAVGPMVQPLVSALEGLIRGVLPGLMAILKAAQPAVTAFGHALSGLGRDLGQMLSAMAPAVRASASVLKALFAVIGGLLPIIGKLAAIFAQALGPVLVSFGQAIKSLEPALITVGKVIGELAGAVLQSLAGALKAVAQLVQAAAPGFTALARALSVVFNAMENSGVFGILENALEAIAGPLGRLVSVLLTGLAPVLTIVVRAVSRVAAQFGSQMVGALKAAMPALMQLARALVQLLKAVTPLIGPLTRLYMSQLKLQMAFLPLMPLVVRLVTLLVELATKAITPLVPLITRVVNASASLTGAIAHVIGIIAQAITAGLRWIGSFQKVKAGALSLISALVGWFSRLPGRILSAVGNLGSLLFDAGKNVIQGLLNGIMSMVGSVGSAIGNIAGEIRNFLPFSPARKGPLSGGGAPDKAGRAIARMLATGLKAGVPDVSAAAGNMVGGVRFGGGRGGTGGGAGGTIVLEFRGGSDSQFWTWFQNGIRAKGGDPAIVVRKVAFR